MRRMWVTSDVKISTRDYNLPFLTFQPSRPFGIKDTMRCEELLMESGLTAESNPAPELPITTEAEQRSTCRVHWFRFTIRHLLALMTLIAIAIVATAHIADRFAAKQVTIQITQYHPATHSMEYEYTYDNGSSKSDVPTNALVSSVDYSKMVGQEFTLRYRAYRILWLPPENHAIASFRLVESEVAKFSERSRKAVD